MFSFNWSKHRNCWIPDLIGIALVFLAATAPFLLFDLDMHIQKLLYTADPQPPAQHWFLKGTTPWRQLTAYGCYPAIAAALGALLVLLLGFFMPACRRYRMASLFLVLVMLIGPGLIVNVILKDNFGRPRPKAVIEFGGTRQYHDLLEKGKAGEGASFPSGHSSTGYYLAAFYFILRRKNMKLAVPILFLSLAYGSLVGFSRMAAGSHFLSDILWSAAIVLLVAFVLYYPALNIPGREDTEARTAPASCAGGRETGGTGTAGQSLCKR